MLSNGTELNVLDCGLSGPVVFDAQTGCVSVDPAPRVPYVPGECEEGIGGYPLVAQAVACRNPGESPDRPVRTLIPRYASTGVLFGFAEACPAYPGASPEVTGFKLRPVEQADAAEGTCPPTGLRLLGARKTTVECGKEQEEWHFLDTITFSTVPPITTETITDDGDSDTANDPFQFAIWEKKTCGTTETVSLRSVPMAEFRRFVSALSITAAEERSKLVELATPVLIGRKVHDVAGVASTWAAFSDDMTDVGPYTGTYKVTGVSGIPANAREVRLRAWVFVDGTSGAASASVTVNGLLRLQSYRNSSHGFGYKNDGAEISAVLNAAGEITFDLQATSNSWCAAASLEITGYRT